MFSRLTAYLFLTLALGLAGGCVERSMVITSEPEGAQVTVNQTWSGTTPFTIPFKHYGVYDIQLRKEGFYPLRVAEPVVAPGYQKMGADFVSEALVPAHIQDRRELHYRMQAIEKYDDMDEVMARGREMKEHVADVTVPRAEEDQDREARALPLRTLEEKRELKRHKRQARAQKHQAESEAENAAPAADTAESTGGAPAAESEKHESPDAAEKPSASPPAGL